MAHYCGTHSIYLHERCLPCHVKCRMPKDGLKLDHAAARHDVVLGEGVPEQMKGSLRHASSNVEVPHSGFQGVNSHLAVAGSGEEVVFALPIPKLKVQFQHSLQRR